MLVMSAGKDSITTRVVFRKEPEAFTPDPNAVNVMADVIAKLQAEGPPPEQDDDTPAIFLEE